MSKSWRRAILLSISGVTVVKIFVALKSSGTIDVFAFREFLTNLHEVGGIGTYYRLGRAGNPFNHPPFILHALRGIGFLADTTPLPFRFWFRLPSVLADLGNLLLVWKILEHTPTLKTSPWKLLLLAVYPVSILISGYHGNTDPVMIFFLLLSIYLLTVGRAAWLAGAAFGMALNIKIVPLIFAPAIFLFLPDMRTRAKFFVTAAAIFFIASLPYIVQDPRVIWKTVFGYQSFYGRWGWTRLVVRYITSYPPPLNANHELEGVHAVIARVGKYFMFACIVAASVWMNRKKNRPPLFLQCGFIVFMFLALTPGYGMQYLSWLIPWVVVLGARSAIFYYAATTSYLSFVYMSISRPTRRLLAGMYQLLPPNTYFVAELVCWLSILVALFSCWRVIRNYGDDVAADETLAETSSGLSLPQETRAAN